MFLLGIIITSKGRKYITPYVTMTSKLNKKYNISNIKYEVIYLRQGSDFCLWLKSQIQIRESLVFVRN
jgi:hypothetical protein